MEKLDPGPVDVVAVGDVIQSEEFVYGERASRDDYANIWVGKLDPHCEREALCVDPSRGRDLFVVEETELSPFFFRPNLLVRARRLNPDGTYNPKGDLIQFFQAENSPKYQIREVFVVGKMEKQVTFV